jgi:hypothetical protein
MILTFLEAKLLLQKQNIPYILQQKILLLFISLGTPSANIIKQECLKLNQISHYNNDVKTLWRLKLYNNNYKITSYTPSIITIVNCDLFIAALSAFPPSSYQNDQNTILNFKTRYHLYEMFYNLDTFHYGEYGTPTANIIRNAIRNNIINYCE